MKHKPYNKLCGYYNCKKTATILNRIPDAFGSNSHAHYCLYHAIYWLNRNDNEIVEILGIKVDG
jgi:hypothetical protein